MILLCRTIPSHSKFVHGRISLAAHKAQVVTKFCFDFNPSCGSDRCTRHPGIFEMRLYDGLPRVPLNDMQPQVTIALLDDEYFSFSEVAPVWDDLNCSEIIKAAKQHFPVGWFDV